MSNRERALLRGVIVGLIVYTLTGSITNWEKADVGLVAASWAVGWYYVTRKAQEP